MGRPRIEQDYNTEQADTRLMEQAEACKKLQEELLQWRVSRTYGEDEMPADCWNEADQVLWELIRLFEGFTFHTFSGLEFSYTVKGGEIFISRKEHSKSLTKSSILMAFHTGAELQLRDGYVKGPKKLGTFGASYLYPMFVRFGVITEKPAD
jgi:hypothetical protein